MDIKLKEYIEGVKEISHTTLDPKGPGVLRIHLVLPKNIKPGRYRTIILNGENILPISLGWAMLLREFINSVNEKSAPLSDEDIDECINEAVKRIKKVFVKTDKKMLVDDLKEIIQTLVAISRGEEPNVDMGYMTLASYAKYMAAPHRMDLMISSMSKDNNWNCNQKCLNCYAGNQKLANTKELTTEEWKQIIDKLRKAMVPQITFTGGEPTLRDDLVELVKYSEWFVTRLNTNGKLLTKSLCDELYEANLDNVQVTFYSSSPAIHNLLVGCDGYNLTVEGIKNAVASGLNVSLNTPLCSLNKDYLSTIKYGHEELGIKYFTCSGLIMTGNAINDNKSLSSEEIYNILSQAYLYAKENNCEIIFTTPGAIPSSKLKEMKMMVPSCGACSSNMAITPDGRVVPCQSWLSSDDLGSIIDEDFNKIWSSKRCKSLRKINAHLNDVCPLTKEALK